MRDGEIIKKYSDIFPWNEFYDRYTKNHEEFCFRYKDKFIHLITDWNEFLYNIGDTESGYVNSRLFNSPEELLKNARFDGKTLQEIWDELS